MEGVGAGGQDHFPAVHPAQVHRPCAQTGSTLGLMLCGCCCLEILNYFFNKVTPFFILHWDLQIV